MYIYVHTCIRTSRHVYSCKLSPSHLVCIKNCHGSAPLHVCQKVELCLCDVRHSLCPLLCIYLYFCDDDDVDDYSRFDVYSASCVHGKEGHANSSPVLFLIQQMWRFSLPFYTTVETMHESYHIVFVAAQRVAALCASYVMCLLNREQHLITRDSITFSYAKEHP